MGSRVGRIRITRDFVVDKKARPNLYVIFSKLCFVPTRVDFQPYGTEVYEMTGLSPLFDEIDTLELPPVYSITVHTEVGVVVGVEVERDPHDNGEEVQEIGEFLDAIGYKGTEESGTETSKSQ
jgi:hypothetical protein